MSALDRDALFVALTRPQMFAGVTYSYFILGRVDKRDSQTVRVLIQRCFLRSSDGSRGLVRCRMGADRATI
ncbi:MAG: VirB3 family type IV secretion system protein, partial [Sphingomonas sp.]